MADLKISELNALSGANLASADELAIVDDSASETKKITVESLIANGVTIISDSTIPGAKILFAAGDIATAALADSAITTAKIADDNVTAAKLANESTVDLVTTLPASGAFTGQLALDTDDNKLYLWNGSSWLSVAAAGSVNTVSGSTTGEVNIISTVSGDTVTISATLDNTTAAGQFLAGPTGSAGVVGYRTIDSGDLPVATTSAKGGVIVNGEGLRMDSNTIEVDNDVTSSSTHHVVTYNAKGLVTGGRIIASSDLPIATASARGAVIASDGLAVDASGNLSIDNTVTSGTYTKVTVTAQGVVSAGETLTAADIPDHSAAKLTSGTIGSSLIANGAVTASKIADQSTVKFGGALGSDNVTIFPTGDFKGQMFWDETSEDLYIYSGSAFIPITVLSGNLVNAGVYDASTNTMSSVTTAGSSAGFSVGAALPAPAANNLNHYVVVSTSGTGSGAAPAVALAPPDMLLSQGVGTEYALIDISNAIAGQTAANISVVASGNIAATDVQAALQELDSEKIQKAGDTMTGALGIGSASSIVFEGSTADDYETTLTVTDPTSDHTITFPDVTGNVVTTGDTGTVTSTMITDGTIVNADINASAEIAVSKLANGTARQLLQTDAAGTGVEFTSNVDVPGTLDVTAAGTFDSTLTVTGLISANGKVSFPAGTAAAPSLYPGSDTNTGIYSPGSDQLAISTNGTGRLFVDASGNVGIGNSSPADSSGYNTLTLGNGTSTGGQLLLENSAGNNFFIWHDSNGANIYNQSATSQIFYTNATERMRIESSGAVTVKRASTYTTGLQHGLAIQQGSATNGNRAGLVFKSLDGFSVAGVNGVISTHSGTQNNNVGYLEFYTKPTGVSAPVERMRIDSSGRVGIGTTSPSRLLHLSAADSTSFSSADFDQTYNFLRIVNTTNDKAAGIYFGIGTNGEAAITAAETTDGETALVFGTRGGGARSERARLDHAGRLLVGTSSSSATNTVVIQGHSGGSSGQGLVYLAKGSATPADGDQLGAIWFSDNTHTASAGVNAQRDGGTWSGSSKPSRLVFSTTADGANSPTVALTINRNQELFSVPTYTAVTTNAANVFVASNGNMSRSSSSRKYKTNIETLEDQYADRILDCRPVWFRSTAVKDNPDHGYWGFIAEEVAEIDPRLVHWKTIEISYNENGSTVEIPCDPEPEGVQYDRFVPHLLNLIKRQKEQIETQSTAIAALEARLTALEAS